METNIDRIHKPKPIHHKSTCDRESATGSCQSTSRPTTPTNIKLRGTTFGSIVDPPKNRHIVDFLSPLPCPKRVKIIDPLVRDASRKSLLSKNTLDANNTPTNTPVIVQALMTLQHIKHGTSINIYTHYH